LSHKTFNHVLVPITELVAEKIDGKRHYTLPDGVTKVKSVTTILGERLDKTSLNEWKARVGEVEASKVSTQAARRGTAIHNIAEKYVLNESNIYKGHMPVNVETFKAIKMALDEHVDNIMGIEIPLYSKALACASKADLIAEYDGVLSVIDYKTSKKLKKMEHIESYIIQTTVYAMMFEQMYNIRVPQIVIIIAVDNEKTPQTFVLERDLYIDRVIEVFAT
jgi:hypothetical protein